MQIELEVWELLVEEADAAFHLLGLSTIKFRGFFKDLT